MYTKTEQDTILTDKLRKIVEEIDKSSFKIGVNLTTDHNKVTNRYISFKI